MGEMRTASRSKAAAVLRSWPARMKQQLGIDPAMVAIYDLLVSACAIAVDDDDPRPLYQRFESDLGTLAEEVFAGIDLDEAVKRIESIVTPASTEITKWVKRFTGGAGPARWLMRAIGSGRYYRARKALKADAAVVVVAMRRLLRWCLPYTVAIDDCASILSTAELTAIYKVCSQGGGNTSISNSLLGAVVQLDREIDRLLDFGIPFPQATARSDERIHLDVPDVAMFANELRAVIGSQSKSAVVEISQALANKIQGARDAMEHSADPVSQAANSLIELIDRLLREAFSENEVLQWVNENLPADDLVFFDSGAGRHRPTKRAQALCFAYAGQRIEQRSPMNEIGAAGLVTARNRMQALKHADRGTPEEIAQLYGLLNAVEAYIVVSIRLGWSIYAHDHDLERLRARFVPAA